MLILRVCFILYYLKLSGTNSSVKLVKKIMLLIFKLDIVNHCRTISTIRKIDFDKKDNFLEVKDMSLGFAIEKCRSDSQKKNVTSKQQIAKFYND